LLLATSANSIFDDSSTLGVMLSFGVLFGVTESTLLIFHHERGRQSFSASEAVLLPMVLALPYEQLVWAIASAMVVVRIRVWSEGFIKHFYNVFQYVISAAAAGGIWLLFGDSLSGFSFRHMAILTLSVLVYAIISHVLTAIVISLAESLAFVKVVTNIATPTLLNLFGNVAIGVLFAAAYAGGSWTVALFPLPLAGLYLGFRAVLRQQGERERIEKLHEASRALASSPDLDQAVIGFLHAVEKIVSAAEARVVLSGRDGWVWFGVRGGDVVGAVEPVEGTALEALVAELQRTGKPLIVDEESPAELQTIAAGLGARSLVSVVLQEEGGCLLALDRVGADAFGPSDAKLLEALADELTLSLDSYRLFAEVAEERERFVRIFTASKEGIMLMDHEGIVRAWNPALENITGYTAAEVTGQLWSNRVVLRTRDSQRIEGAGLVDVDPDTEYELVTRQGPGRWVALLTGPVQTGEDQGWVVMMRDVTAEHSAEEAKSDFLATISHELRTPLTAIKGSLQVLDRLVEEETDAGQMVGVLQRGADRLERLVLNLLFMSQVETDGTLDLVTDEVDMTYQVRHSAEVLLRDHPRVQLDLPPGPVMVRADRERFLQAVDHVLENAMKHAALGRIRLSVSIDNGYAQLEVTDDGPGIEPEDQERIFERFVRLGDPMTRESQGAGVGLFIARRSLEAMGGRIWLESTPGEGATFHIAVPLARPMAVAG
jgi:PAS domain S-box-containing protein